MVKFFERPFSPDFNLIENAHSSLMGALNETMSDMKDQKLLREDSQVFLLENHVLTEGFPETDLILLNGFSMEIEDKIATIGFQIGVSMKDDVNLYNHYKVISYLHDRFRPMTTINIFSSNGDLCGTMTLLDASLLSPVSKASTRCVQLLDLMAKSDITSK